MVEKAIRLLLRSPGLYPSIGLPSGPIPLWLVLLPRFASEAPIFCAYLDTDPTVFAEMPAALSVNVWILLMWPCVVGVKVIGSGLGFVFCVKLSA